MLDSVELLDAHDVVELLRLPNCCVMPRTILEAPSMIEDPVFRMAL